MELNNASRAIIGQVFGVNPSTVSRWVQRGLPKNKDGTFSIPATVEWAVNQAKADNIPDETEESRRWLTEFRKERALISRIERQKMEEKLISREDVVIAWVWRIGEVKTGLESLKDRLSPLLVGKTRKEISKILADEVWNLLDNYSRNGKFTPKSEADKVLKNDRKPAGKKKSIAS